MENATQLQEYLTEFGASMLLFLPVLFGAVEFIKDRLGLAGRAVELLALGLSVLFGVLVVVADYFPEKGLEAAAIVLFLLMCALAPSGYYKFVDARAPKKQANN